MLTQLLSWHYIFAIQGLLLIVSVALMHTSRGVTRSEPRAQGAFDWPAAVLFFGAIAALVSALVSGPPGNWLSAAVLVPAGVGVLCPIGLIMWERRVEHPLLSFRLIAQPRF